MYIWSWNGRDFLGGWHLITGAEKIRLRQWENTEKGRQQTTNAHH